MRSFLRGAIAAVVTAVACVSSGSAQAADDERIYEMRTYIPAEGKMDDLLARFRNHTTGLFEKHGMTNVAYFVPVEDPKSKLVYFLSYPSMEARQQAWEGFRNDPQWKRVAEESQRDGRLVQKVESVFMTPTDFSMNKLEPAQTPRIFELRTYTASEGNLDNLHARFRDHTIDLFEKHGIENIIYFELLDDQEGADNTLIYLVAHDSIEKRNEAFRAFGQDPQWQAARKASEEGAGGSLTQRGGVNYEFLQPTDFSPLK